MNTGSEPHSVFFNQRKYFFVSNRVDISDDQKLFIILNELRHIFPKERKWRVGNDDICLLQQFNTFIGSEIAVTVQNCECVFPVTDEQFHIGEVDCSIAVDIDNLGNFDFIRPLLNGAVDFIEKWQFIAGNG